MQLPMKPMLAQLTDVSDALLERKGMSFEPKWDGYRLIAEGNGDGPASLWSRSGKRCTSAWPEVGEALQDAGVSAVLDGEIVVMRDGRPSFNGLQNIGSMSRQQRKDALRYMVFDVVETGGWFDTTKLPYYERRQILADVVGMMESPLVQLTPATTDGRGLWQAMELAQMEGMIGKPLDSRYRQGERASWLKLKRKARGEFVVVGWTWGKEGVTGARVGSIGALVLAVRTPDGSLVYAGKVGTGFDGSSLSTTKADLETVRTDVDPFLGAECVRARKMLGAEKVVWVAPERVATVEYAELGKDGIPRFPSFKGMR